MSDSNTRVATASILAGKARYDKGRISLIHTSEIGNRGWRHIGKVETGKDRVTLHGLEFRGGESMSSPSLTVRLVVTMKEKRVCVDRQVDAKD